MPAVNDIANIVLDVITERPGIDYDGLRELIFDSAITQLVENDRIRCEVTTHGETYYPA